MTEITSNDCTSSPSDEEVDRLLRVLADIREVENMTGGSPRRSHKAAKIAAVREWFKQNQRNAVETTANERTLRRLLAFAYSGSALYGDDGELQDGRHPMIDYVRDSVPDIERKIHERGMAKLAAAACPTCRYVVGHAADCSGQNGRS